MTTRLVAAVLLFVFPSALWAAESSASDDWLTIFDRFGVPLAMLIILGVGLWRIAKWMGVNVVTPITQAHLGFLQRLDSAIENQTQMMGGMRDTLGVIQSILAELRGRKD